MTHLVIHFDTMDWILNWTTANLKVTKLNWDGIFRQNLLLLNIIWKPTHLQNKSRNKYNADESWCKCMLHFYRLSTGFPKEANCSLLWPIMLFLTFEKELIILIQFPNKYLILKNLLLWLHCVTNNASFYLTRLPIC